MGNFEYFKPRDYNELLSTKEKLLERGILFAGGSNLMVYIKEKSIREGTLLDISGLPDLKGISADNGSITIGAAETITSIMESPIINENVLFFAESLHDFANPLIRNKATIGGNIGDSSPVADTAPILLILDSSVYLESKGSSREIPLNDFFTGPRKNVLKENEVIKCFTFKVPENGRGVYLKFGLRKGTSIAVTSVALWLSVKENHFEEVKIALGGVAPTPIRAKHTEEIMKGKKVELSELKTLCKELTKDMSPISDVRGSAEYRREVTINLLEKAIRKCLGAEE